MEKVNPIAGSDSGSPVLVCSFTRTAAAEVAGRGLPIPREAVGTLHAHAYRALRSPKLAEGEPLAQWNTAHPEWAMSGATAKDADDLDAPEELSPEGMPGDELRSAYELLRARMIPRERWDITGARVGNVATETLAKFVDDYEDWKTSSEVFDFTDLIGAALSLPPPMNPSVIVVDEVQDLSRLEWQLVSDWAEQAGAMIAVGDPWQSLYSWRGAYPELFDVIRKESPERLRTLSQSYRVPSRIVAASLAWMDGFPVGPAPEYRARRDEKGETVEGEVAYRPEWTPRRFGSMIDDAVSRSRSGQSVMIEATCSFMLNDVVSELRSRGVAFANPWRTKRGDWNPISTRGTTTYARAAAFAAPLETGKLWTWAEVNLWTGGIKVGGTLRRGAREAIAEKAKRRPQEIVTSLELNQYIADPSIWSMLSNIQGTGVNHETLAVSFGWLRERIAGGNWAVWEYAAKLLASYGRSPPKPNVYVGTVHSFKGAEADNVYLFSELSAAARRGFEGGDPRSTASVARTLYVGMTRARSRLVVCGSSAKDDRLGSWLVAKAQQRGVVFS